jgi:hypothetical protein
MSLVSRLVKQFVDYISLPLPVCYHVMTSTCQGIYTFELSCVVNRSNENLNILLCSGFRVDNFFYDKITSSFTTYSSFQKALIAGMITGLSPELRYFGRLG